MTDAGPTPPDPTIDPAAPAPAPYPAYAPYAGTGPAPSRPGRVTGIVGFILSFFFVLNLGGLVVSIIALVQSKRAGLGNGFAVAGITISIVGILFSGGILAVLIPSSVALFQECAKLGTGTHVVGNATYTCTPTSANVYTN